MSETLTACVKVNITADLVGDNDLGSRDYHLAYSKVMQLAHGTAANQANQIWTDKRNLGVSATEDLDLYGVLVSPLGTTLNFTKIKCIFVYAYSTNTNNVIIGGNAAGLVNWVGNKNDVINLRPGSFMCLTAPDNTGYGVTTSTGDILTITNSSSGTAVDYDIIIMGVV